MNPAIKAIAIVLALPVLGMGAVIALFYFAFTTKLQKLRSPDAKHMAELVRTDFIDRNYRIYIDAARVYSSPDFTPSRDIPFRDFIMWDSTGTNLIFEVGGRRVAGFSVKTHKRLSDADLLALQPSASPPLKAYGYEAEWPGIGRDRDVESRDSTATK